MMPLNMHRSYITEEQKQDEITSFQTLKCFNNLHMLSSYFNCLIAEMQLFVSGPAH